MGSVMTDCSAVSISVVSSIISTSWSSFAIADKDDSWIVNGDRDQELCAMIVWLNSESHLSDVAQICLEPSELDTRPNSAGIREAVDMKL
jgi:hypothetical protein